MARPRLLDAKLVEHAKRLAAQADSVADLRCAQAVLLPALLGATLEQTATALGVGRATVGRCQAKVRKRLSHPAQLDPVWGGRRRAAMSVEEEFEFLEPWAESAADGGMLIFAPLRAALAQRLGRPVTHSVVYRLLERHGWRKVARWVCQVVGRRAFLQLRLATKTNHWGAHSAPRAVPAPS